MEVNHGKNGQLYRRGDNRAHQIRDQAKTALELRKALSVLLIAEGGLDTDKTAGFLKISERTVFRNQEHIRKQDKITENTWGGRRRYTYDG